MNYELLYAIMNYELFYRIKRIKKYYLTIFLQNNS